MTVEIWLAYVGTVLLLMSTPGPSQLLMLSNSATNGLGRGLFSAFGDLTANLLQMLAAGLGLAAVHASTQVQALALDGASRASAHRFGQSHDSLL